MRQLKTIRWIETRELWRKKRNGIFEVCVYNQRHGRIALFCGRRVCVGGEFLPQEKA